MPTLEALRDEFRHLAIKGFNVLNDETLPSATRTRQYNEMQPRLKALGIQIAESETKGADTQDVNARAKSLMAMTDPGTASGPVSDRSILTGAGPGEAPPLHFSSKSLEALFKAASEGDSISIKTITSSDEPMSAVPEVRLAPVPFMREPFRVASILASSSTDRGSVDYYTTTAAATGASTVGEGGVKPESSLTYTKVNAPVRKIAHWTEVTDEALSDYQQFLMVAESEMVAGLIHEENHQLLAGAGTGNDIGGLLTNGSILTQAKASDTRWDAIAKAVVKLRVGTSYAEATDIILHPTDWSETLLEKDTQGRYISGNPADPSIKNAWGLNVALTTDIPLGTALVGDFKTAAATIWRLATKVDVNTQAEAQWKSNKVLIRAEERLALAIFKPTCLCSVTGL